MDIQTIVLLGITGLLAGLIAGGLGVGGGIIIIPALVFIFGFTQHQAQGTCLAVLLLPSGILALMNYHKKGFVNYQYAIILVLALFIGSYLGSLVAVSMPDRILKKIFGVLMIIAGIKIFFDR